MAPQLHRLTVAVFSSAFSIGNADPPSSAASATYAKPHLGSSARAPRGSWSCGPLHAGARAQVAATGLSARKCCALINPYLIASLAGGPSGETYHEPVRARHAVAEGLHNKAKLTIRKRHRFRPPEILEMALYHALGKLPELKLTSKFY